LPWTFAVAALNNLVISLFHSRLNPAVQARPLFLSVDLLVCAALIAASGGVYSPFYLYAFSPLLAAAFFFRIRGGLLAASALSLLYAGSAAISIRYFGGSVDPPVALSQVAGFYLIAGIFGYPSVLLGRLRRSAELLRQMHDELVSKNVALERMNRELRSVHALVVTLQSAAVDIRDVQERVLNGIVNELGFARAAMALVDYEQGVVTRWLMLGRDGGEADDSAYTAAVPIDGGGGAVIETLQTRDVCVRENGAPPTSHEELNRRLGLSRYAVLPMLVRSIPIGVLIVEGRDGQVLGLEGLASAKAVAEHGSLILWTTRMCMERAQRLATQEERDRIAREIHDAVSQSLFGIAFTLDGCLRLLPHQAELVREKLQELHGLALRTMADMRRFIFDMSLGGLTTDQFIDELQDYIHDMGSPEGLTVGVSVDGDITELSPYTRKHLFRIAQEALARLSVTDNGKGISHEKASTGGGLGLTSIRERVRSIGGTLDIRCAPGEGTRIEVRVPRL
jgi:signal transduction histidine kinase